ncbi:MAG: hypothetical protein K0S47_3610 [Herbinix sp.]|jgi:hypothetical protein|nr:hypothetical protein [Herbinix sp.]
MRKIILFLLLFVMCINISILAACNNNVSEDSSPRQAEHTILPTLKEDTNNKENEEKESEDEKKEYEETEDVETNIIPNEERAKQLLENVLKLYKKNQDQYFLHEYYPKKDNEASTAYLWSYFGALGMMYQMNRLFPTDTNIREEYQTMLDNLAFYKNADSNDLLAKYNSARGTSLNNGIGDIFFDDNIWIARNMLFAYEIFGDEEYLAEAIRVTNFIYTGWNEEIGGLVWNENGLGTDATPQELERGLSANACSIIVNVKLYELTQDENYLNWALKFYDFCKQMQNSDTGIYYNGIHTVIKPDGTRINGSINKDLYAYNTGSMILADLLLYDITKEEEYYIDAKKAAATSHTVFMKEDNNVQYYKGYPWFIAILIEGYEALSHYDSDFTTPFMDVLKTSLDYASNNYMNYYGMLPSNLATGFNANYAEDRQLLTQSAYAEMYALLALMN